MTTETNDRQENNVQQDQQGQQKPAKKRFVDLWSRPGPWARKRAYIFLCINVLVYVLLTVFIFWMHNGKLFDFSWLSYSGAYSHTLIDFLIFPISIQDAPIMVPVIGMLMANIIVVPILIAQLYGFRYSIAFSLCVLIFSHLPMLCFFLIASSFIASAGKHKLPFKFGVTLLGLLPLTLYFYLATQGAVGLQLRLADPTLLYAPWILAFLAAAGIAAIVLVFARIVHYRPGGVLIGMIPFFLIPMLLFQRYIGADQLEFRLLVHRYGPDSIIFAPVDISGQVFQDTLKAWRRYKIRNLQEIVDLATTEFPYVAAQYLQNDRDRILEVFNEFQTYYPHSRFIPNAMYIYGLTQDMHFDFGVLQRKWTVEYTTDLVSPQSAPTWRTLIEKYPDSIYAEPARLRLAIQTIRDGHPEVSKMLLRQLLAKAEHLTLTPSTQPAEAVTTLQDLFSEPKQTNIPQIDMSSLLEEAQELLELIENNENDPQFGVLPLSELMKLDSHHPKYRDHLLAMAIKFTGSKLHENLLVRYADTDPDPAQRRVLLERYSDYFLGRDAGAEALYRLANLLEAWGLANMDSQAYRQAEERYSLVIKNYPKSIYATRAKARLKQLKKLDPDIKK
jgi:outer membrane protein assembly factor BamD (BamD/ComL family)